MAGSYQGFGSGMGSQPMQYRGWNQVGGGQPLPYTGQRQMPSYQNGGFNPGGGMGQSSAMPPGNTGITGIGGVPQGPFTGGQDWGMSYPSVPKPMTQGQPSAGFIPGQQIGQGMQGPGGGFGPQPPMQPGGFDPIAAQNARMGGMGGVSVDPSLARQRVQQGVMGGGGYSMQDMADAGMGSADLNTMIQSFRAGNMAPVDMTAQQAQGLQQASALRNRSSPYAQGVQNLLKNLPGFLAR